MAYPVKRWIPKWMFYKVTIIPIVISSLGTVTKGLIKRVDDLEISGQVETI